MASAKKPNTNGVRAKLVELKKIRLDGDTQSRNELDQDVIKEYTGLMDDGVEFPPLVVVEDGSDYWLVDGFHRRWAAIKAKKAKIKCVVHKGDVQLARWMSYGANKDHGLRRHNEDKQKAVIAALKHPNGAGKADSKLAAHVGVSPNMVKKYREQLESSSQIAKMETREVTRNGTTYEQDTTNIGTTRPDPKPPKERNFRTHCPDNSPHSMKCGRCVKCGENGRGEVVAAPKEETQPEVVESKGKGKISGGTAFDTAELEPSDVKDGLGNEPPPALREVFGKCEEFDQQRNALTQVKKWFNAIKVHAAGALIEKGYQRLVTDLNNLDSEIKFAKPFAVCPYCKNKMPKLANCEACKGAGWVSKEVYDSCPKDMKHGKATA